MEHSISSAIRTVGAQICRRLDVLIEAAGKPPVQDIEGTLAPRKPLAHNVKMSSVETPVEPAKKRGRPPKNKTPTPVSKTSSSSDSDENDKDQQTPLDEHAEVSAIFFFFVCFTNTWQVQYCPEHKLFSLVHGVENYMKETYTRSEMLAFEVTEDELVSAGTEADTKAKLLAANIELRKQSKCICFPWVRIFFFLLPVVFLILFCRLIIAANIDSFGLVEAGDFLSQKSKRQVTKRLRVFGHLPLGLDAVAILTPKIF